MTQLFCQACGDRIQPISPDFYNYNINPQEHTINGNYLPEKTWELFTCFYKNRGKIIGNNYIAHYIWNEENQPLDVNHAIRTHVFILNKFLKQTQFEIRTRHKFGRKMVIKGEQE